MKHITILPNGYGKLKYCDTLEHCLTSSGYDVNTIVHMGQVGGKLGCGSVREAADHLVDIFNSNLQAQTQILVHCSGVIPLIRASAMNPECMESVSAITIYSLLANPMRLRKQYLRKSHRFGTTIDLLPKDFAPLMPCELEQLRVPIRVVHPQTRENFLRANEAELHELSNACNVNEIIRPSNGYSITDAGQMLEIERFVTEFY